MKKKLDKLKKYWLLYKTNKQPIHEASKLAWRVFWMHRKLGLAKAREIATGYFKLGLAWSGFKYEHIPTVNKNSGTI